MVGDGHLRCKRDLDGMLTNLKCPHINLFNLYCRPAFHTKKQRILQLSWCCLSLLFLHHTVPYHCLFQMKTYQKWVIVFILLNGIEVQTTDMCLRRKRGKRNAVVCVCLNQQLNFSLPIRGGVMVGEEARDI